MDKQTLLRELSSALASGAVTKKEIDELTKSIGKQKHASLPAILSYIGGGIVLLGIVIFIAQQWLYFGPTMRILFTLVIGIILYIVAFILHKDPRTHIASFGLFLASFGLLPGGFWVLFDIAGIQASIGMFTVLALITSLITVATFIMFRHPFFLLTVIASLTWLYYSFVVWIDDQTGSYWEGTVYGYLIALQGIIYLLIGHFLSIRWAIIKSMKSLLYFFGVFTAMGAFFGLTFEQDFWLWTYILLVAGCVYLSILLSRRVFLVAGSLFLIAYIIRITVEYFTDSVGWPIALIFIGILIIGIALTAVRINKRFLTKKDNSTTVTA